MRMFYLDCGVRGRVGWRGEQARVEYHPGGLQAMPLRDHFRPPLDDLTSWEGFHGQWPAMIVLALAGKLPPRYVAAPRVHSGASVEVDVAPYEKDEPGPSSRDAGDGNAGGVATA